MTETVEQKAQNLKPKKEIKAITKSIYGEILKDFPEFMKNPLNKIDPHTQYTPGIEGYVFDGRDESQMAFWTYNQNAKSTTHSHEYDEYIVVVQGQYTVILDNEKITLNPGDEYLIGKGVSHGGEATSGTRAIYAFGGKRATRKIKE